MTWASAFLLALRRTAMGILGLLGMIAVLLLLSIPLQLLGWGISRFVP